MDAISYKQKEYLYSYFRSKPPELNLHLHKYYEFLYFISGDATYIVEDNLYKIHPGDILLTRPGELHTIFFQSEKPYERIFMQIHPDFITEFDLFDKINSSPIGENNRIPSDIVQSFGLYDYFKNVEHYILNRVPESDTMIKSYFLQFLVAVNHALDNTILPIKPTNNNRIDDIIDYLTDNISADITLDFLAEKFSSRASSSLIFYIMILLLVNQNKSGIRLQYRGSYDILKNVNNVNKYIGENGEDREK